MGALTAGTPAPEFQLNSTPDQRVSLSDFRGQRVILAFYPADWSPICGDQLALYNELRDEFAKHRAICIGISVDGAWCHAAYREQRGYMSAVRSGAAGTPSFFINGEHYEGSFDDESLIEALRFAAQASAPHVRKGPHTPRPRAH